MNWASRVFGCTVVLCAHLVCQDGWASHQVTFSQERVAFDSMGNCLPVEVIDPSRMAGVSEHRFALDRQNILVIRTNIENPEDRGLSRVAGTVREGYLFVQEKSGRQIAKDILLYLFEFERVPEYYRFEVTCSDEDANWCEVRLALVSSGDPLQGPGAPENLEELLFDTLPHELGHDLLAGIPSLQDQGSEDAAFHGRWFAEGVCELLAKGFSRQMAPDLWRRYLAARQVYSVLEDPETKAHVFPWTKGPVTSMRLESDLYGASMLLMMAWTEIVSLRDILVELDRLTGPVTGGDIVRLMERTTGLRSEQMLERAHWIGRRLGRQMATRLVPDP